MSQHPRSDDHVVLVENGGLPRSHAVRRRVEQEPEPVLGLLHRGRDRGRPVPPFDLGAIHPDVQPSTDGNRFDGKRLPRPDDDRVRAGIGAQHVERLCRRDPQPAALAGREAPEAVMSTELTSLLVDDLALGLLDAVPPDEVAVVAPAEKARFLALATPGDSEPGARGLGSGLVLRLLAEWEPDPVEDPRLEAGEHVGLVLLGVAGARQQPSATVLDDPRVVPGRKARSAGPLGEGEQLRETKAAVAADTWIRRLAVCVATNERSHDSPAKLVAQVERHV